ncbi:AlpA family phage regulatory protein [Sphingobium sp. WCS2017Hpa-17]|uniref:helix-turn-helix transcriptional regulator n=1 Tax=Sphingobium sp. WCS2017Hpa-17 TaxID=3073638 RepID=UPI002889F25C|nr:AlpA family phage regulatory protein [Sphingobium sp. WCS2017Hpa-17]
MKDFEEQFLRIGKVMAKTGKPRSSIYREMKAGTFPRPERIGPRAVAWRLSKLQRWMESPRDYHSD